MLISRQGTFWSRAVLFGVLAVGLLLGVPAAVDAGPVSGELFFTTFAGGQNVNRVSFNYNGTNSFTLGSIVNIASTPGADGLIFTTDGFLAVGGQANRVHRVNPNTGTFTTRNAGGTNAFHMMMSPDGIIYSAGIPGDLASYNGTLTNNGTFHNVTGSVGNVTTVAWDSAGNAFYTSSGSGGNGSFGRINMNTFVTTQLIANVPAAHGMAFDPYTGLLVLFGDNFISQIDPNNPTVIVSTRTFNAALNFDQGTVDGQGHVFAADNNGRLVFLDYTTTGRVGTADFVSSQFLAANLDDIAPLVGPGARAVPEPSSCALLGLGGLGMLAYARLRRKSRPELLVQD